MMSNLVNRTSVSSKMFSYSNQVFVSEISTVGSYVGRIYSDSADNGFIMESAKTGKKIVFVEHNEEWKDGDLQVVVFKCVSKGFEHLTVKLFND